jgi:hypothetical protein
MLRRNALPALDLGSGTERDRWTMRATAPPAAAPGGGRFTARASRIEPSGRRG